MRGETGPDFIEALARGLDVIRAFEPNRPIMTLSEVAAASGLARPTARRMLLTLEKLGYVRSAQGGFALTPRVLELGMAYIGSTNIWDIARPHMERLVGCTGESSSLAQLDGSDIVYVARVAVPKIITLAVTIGTRFPALQTSLGKVLLAALPPNELERTLALPSRSGIAPLWRPDVEERNRVLCEVRARGWALTDEHLVSRYSQSGHYRAQRQRSCRRNQHRETDRRVPAAAVADCLRHQRRLGALAEQATGHSRRQPGQHSSAFPLTSL